MSSFNYKERRRIYLPPGTDRCVYRRKQTLLLKCAVITGLSVAGILATLMYWMNRTSS